jgi:hypothetical protein
MLTAKFPLSSISQFDGKSLPNPFAISQQNQWRRRHRERHESKKTDSPSKPYRIDQAGYEQWNDTTDDATEEL